MKPLKMAKILKWYIAFLAILTLCVLLMMILKLVEPLILFLLAPPWVLIYAAIAYAGKT